MDGHIIIDKRTGLSLGDLKLIILVINRSLSQCYGLVITCCMAPVLHVLNDFDTEQMRYLHLL